MSVRSAEYEARRALAAFGVLLAGRKAILWIFGLWVSINWFSAALYEMLQGKLHWVQLGGLALPIMLYCLHRKAEKVAEQSGPVHFIDQEPEKCRAPPEHPFEVVALAEMDKGKWAKGVPFDDPAAWLSALRDAFDGLHRQGVRDRDIVVDVTGGPKVATAAGAAVTIGAERRFQYVNTLDYRVLSFDIRYEEHPA